MSMSAEMRITLPLKWYSIISSNKARLLKYFPPLERIRQIWMEKSWSLRSLPGFALRFCFFLFLSLRLWLDDLTSNVLLLILLVPFTGRSTTPHQLCYFHCLYRFTIISSYNTVDCAKPRFSHLSPCALNLPSLRGRDVLLSLNDSVVLKRKQLKSTSFHQLTLRIFSLQWLMVMIRVRGS